MPTTDLPLAEIQLRTDAVVAALPEGIEVHTRFWRGGGLFRGDGRPDLSVAPMMVEQPPLDAQRMAGADHLSEGIFCGRFRGHFGHFLAESMGRIWAAEAFPPDMPLIWFNDPVQKGTGVIRKSMMKALGLKNPQVIVEQALRVDRLHLPPSLTDPLYQIAPAPEYQAWFRARLPSPPAQGPDIYISRSQMPDKAGRFFGEAAIEAGLKAEGYRIVFPERMSLDEQIVSYRAARRIVAAEGSPLHLLALLDIPGQKVATLMRRPRVVGTLKHALLAFRSCDLLLVDQIRKTWAASAKGNLFSVVSELDIAGVWGDLAADGFIRDAALMPVPDAAALKDERLTRAPGRKVRLAIGKRDLG